MQKNKLTSFESVRHQHKALLKKRLLFLILLAAGLFAAFCLDIAVGPSTLPFGELLKTIFSPGQADPGMRVIVWEIRLPYSVMAILVGACLSLAGAELQTIMNNSLASPFTLGISDAASFGAALAIVLNFSVSGISDEWTIAANAFMLAFGSVILLQFLARMKGSGVETLVLFGIAMVFAFKALLGLVQYIASAEALQQLVFWTLGSLTRANWDNITALAIVMAVVIPFSIASSWKMTALRLGEESAASYGVHVKRLRFFSLIRVSLLSAAAVSFVGVIGFIGLVGPHIARLLTGEDHRYFLPASILCGAIIMALASAGSKAVVPGVIMPVGIVTSLIGVPVFILLILSKNNRW